MKAFGAGESSVPPVPALAAVPPGDRTPSTVPTQVMGVINVTPDSFSDGGRYFSPDEAVRRALNMAAEGADIVDLGGESTRPGATPISQEEEWVRIEPVLTALVARWKNGKSKLAPPRISIDTYHPETAARALAAGADIVNCVSPASAAEMLRLCAGTNAELVLPVRLVAGIPTVGTTPLSELLPPTPPAFHSSLSTFHLYLDPMIGFGTTREEDLALLRSVPDLARFGRVLVGASRKRIVKKLTGEKVTGKNLGGNLGLAVWCALHGASVVRVHDVAETVQALRVVATLAADTGLSERNDA